MSIRLAVVLLSVCACVCSAEVLREKGQDLKAQQQRHVISGRAGRALLKSDVILPSGLASLFRKRSMPDGGAVSTEAAETMLPPTIIIPADLNLESITPADAEKFVTLFSKVAHRGNGGLTEALQQATDQNVSGASSAAPTHDILESGQLLQKIQAEGVPVVHDSTGTPPPSPSKEQPAPAAGSPAATPTPAAAAAPTASTPAPTAAAPATAPAPAPAAAATPPSTGNTTNTPASSNSTAPASSASSSNETAAPAAPAAPAEVDVMLIPTDPYASATTIPVVPYTGGIGGSFNDAAMQALINKAGGLAAFREKVTKLEAGGQQAGSRGSHTLSGGGIAGLVIGLCIAAACVAWFVTMRVRSEKGTPRARVAKQPSYTGSADAEIDVAGGDTPRAAGHYRSNSAGGFQPNRAVGRFAGASYPGQSRS